MTVDYKCEHCGSISEVSVNSPEELPKRKDCSGCNEKRSCYRMFGNSAVVIPDSFKTTGIIAPGANYARGRMKNYKGPLNRKTYY